MINLKEKTGVQRRLELNRQDGVNEKTNKISSSTKQQPKYQPPIKNNINNPSKKPIYLLTSFCYIRLIN